MTKQQFEAVNNLSTNTKFNEITLPDYEENVLAFLVVDNNLKQKDVACRQSEYYYKVHAMKMTVVSIPSSYNGSGFTDVQC